MSNKHISERLTYSQQCNIQIAAWFTPSRSPSSAKALNDGEEDPDAQPWGLPLHVLGRPGGGKTSGIEALAKRCGLDCVTISLNTRSPEDVGGYSVTNKTRTGMIKLPDSYVDQVNSSRRCVLVFDEFSIDEERQGAALRVISDRMAGEVRLKNSVRTVAISNPSWCAATPHEMSLPMANRFGHYHWVGFNDDERDEYFENLALGIEPDQLIDPDEHEARVMKEFPAAMLRAYSLWNRFRKAFPQYKEWTPLGVGANDSESAQGDADELRWLSERSGEMITRALASAYVHKLSETETEAFLQYFMPPSVANKFRTFRRDLDVEPASEYLNGNVEFAINRKIDRTHVILDSCVGAVLSAHAQGDEDLTLEWGAKLYEMLGEVGEHEFAGREFIVRAVKRLVKAGVDDTLIIEAEPVLDSLTGVFVDRKRARQRRRSRTLDGMK